ncbi:MAG TPA: hypothetical protein DIT07_10880, partial [Sphingobacteriaceae bacterium]|nr:hypothetical protein [Sphingobacteriaceae bacterium]
SISGINGNRIKLKAEIIAYLHILEPLIKDPNVNLGVSIVIVHADLETRINKAFEDYKFIRKIIYDFARWSLKG